MSRLNKTLITTFPHVSNSIGDEGGCQGGIGVNSNGFLRCWARGASTPNLVVTGFRMVRTDRPGFSLCAAPLESFGPVFQDERGDGMNERRSGVYQTRVSGGVTARRGVEQMILTGK